MGIDIEAVKKAIALPHFQKTKLLEIALIHPSRIYEDFTLNRQQKDLQELQYRRQAILGDSIFNAAVVDYLVSDDRFSSLNQGDITNKFKSPIVSRAQHFQFASKLNLRQLCLLGRGERDRDNGQMELFAEMFEALVGAVYLDFERDFSRTRSWLVERFISSAVDDRLTTEPSSNNYSLGDTAQEISGMNSTEAVELLRQMKHKADALVASDPQLQELLNWIKQKSLLVGSEYKPEKVRAFYLALVHLLALAVVRNFEPERSAAKARTFASSFIRARDVALDLAFNCNPSTDPANVLVSVLAQDLEPELKKTLQQLIAELPDPKKHKEEFQVWRQKNGSVWVERIKNVLGFDLQLSDEQRDLLKDYYKANKLLVECLNNSSSLELAQREEIEKSLFLSIDDGKLSP